MRKQDIINRSKTTFLALEDLTPNQIAQHLESLGIKGRMGSANTCPIAKYVEFVVNPDKIVLSTTSSSTIIFVSPEGIKINHPDNVKEFIWNFDGGRYPELKEAWYE